MRMSNTPNIWTNHKLWALAIAETGVWAGLYYLFPAALLEWNSNFGWSIETLSIGFSIALICSAISGIIAGRLIDQNKSRMLMPLSTLFGAGLLCLMPQVTQIWHFYLLWGAIGIALAGCLYEPCFSFLTKTYQEHARNPIIMVTLVAGFASTLCYPCFSWLSEVYGWESAIYVFAAVTCIICVPLFWHGTSIKRDSQELPIIEESTFAATTTSLLYNPIFWGIFVTFVALSLNHGMIVSQIFPLFEDRQLSPTMAILFASCIGPMQVIARLILFVTENVSKKNIPAIRICAVSLICLGMASLLLHVGTNSVLLVAVFVALQGGPHGLISIIRPVITAELMGRVNFGLISSMVAFGAGWGSPIAPALAGSISERFGYEPMLLLTASTAFIGLASLIAVFTANKSAHHNLKT